MDCNFNNKGPVCTVARYGRCARGPAKVKQTNEDLFYEKNNPINDYIFERVIAEGSFSRVYIARNIHTEMIYAVKVTHVMDSIKTEKEVLCLLMKNWRQTAPFFVQLFESFQHFNKLYLVQPWYPNRSLLHHLKKMRRFRIELAKFYAAEILIALEHLHNLGIIHMALKAKNILLDENMHIKITCFGSSKILGKWENPEVKDHVKTLSGTIYYISPEVLVAENLEISRTSDLWAFGSIIYEMISGVCPFQCKSEGVVFKDRFNLLFYFPVVFCPFAKDLVQKLLSPDPSQRLGAKDDRIYTSIRSHPFFANIEYDALYRQTPPKVYQELPGTSLQGGISGQSKVTRYFQPTVHDGEMTKYRSLIKKTSPSREPPLGLSSLTPSEQLAKLVQQKETLPKWHSLCHGNLILKQGLLDKGITLYADKMLFQKKVMILLTLGPHLYLANPKTETIMEEIPWSPELHVEHKNFKVFLIHTLKKIYYFRDLKNTALNWCAAIEEVLRHTYKDAAQNF